MNEINVKQIKEINNQCNAYKKKASELLAEKEYKTKTLNEMCARLSELLGVTVTTENLEQIYNERVEKITSTLKVCNDMIERIKLQESGVSVPEVQTQAVGQGMGNNGLGQVVGNTVRQEYRGQVVENTNQSVAYQGRVETQVVNTAQGSLAGLPTSDYRIPTEMLDMMPQNQSVQANVAMANGQIQDVRQSQGVGAGTGAQPTVKPTSFANLGGTVNLKQFMQSVPKDNEEVDGI